MAAVSQIVSKAMRKLRFRHVKDESRCSRTSIRYFVAFGALFDLGWDCTLGVVALAADRERRARLG